MSVVSHAEMSKILRDELKNVLQGPGITWNLHGILNAFDRAMSATAWKVTDQELQAKR